MEGKKVDRRGFVTSAAVASVALGVMGSAGVASAAGKKFPKGKLPSHTPIVKLGLNKKEVAMLTPNAKKLDKEFLDDLSDLVDETQRRLHIKQITIRDIDSAEKAMNSFVKRTLTSGGAIASDTSCCCSCTPCCTCAVSVVRPVRVA